MNILPYLSIVVGIVLFLGITYIRLTKNGLLVGVVNSRMNRPRGLVSLRNNKFAIFLFVCSVLALTAFGWNKYLQTIQLNLSPEETVNKH